MLHRRTKIIRIDRHVEEVVGCEGVEVFYNFHAALPGLDFIDFLGKDVHILQYTISHVLNLLGVLG